MGRSGTTLLGRLLAIHPDVGFLNEPKALWHVAHPYEDIIGSYGPPESGRLRLGAEDASPDVVERAHAMFAWFRRLTRSKRIVDKYPELVFRRDFVRKIFPDARFLIATRSPGPTLASVAKWSTEHGDDVADWWGLRDQKWRIFWREAVAENPANADLEALRLGDASNHAIRAAIEWVATMRESITASEEPGTMVVSYDRLVESPADQVRSAIRFSRVSPSLATEQYAQHTVTRRQDSNVLPASLPDDLSAIVRTTQQRLTEIGGCMPPLEPQC
jgi:hypothetical protein